MGIDEDFARLNGTTKLMSAWREVSERRLEGRGLKEGSSPLDPNIVSETRGNASRRSYDHNYYSNGTEMKPIIATSGMVICDPRMRDAIFRSIWPGDQFSWNAEHCAYRNDSVPGCAIAIRSSAIISKKLKAI